MPCRYICPIFPQLTCMTYIWEMVEEVFGGMHVGVYNGPQVQAGKLSGTPVE